MKFDKKDRKFQGIWIPSHIWFDHKRPLLQRIFLLEINSLDNEKGCFASNAYFSQMFGVSKERCSQIINAIKKDGLIAIEYERNGQEYKKRTIKLTDRGIKYIKGGIKYSNTLSNDKVNTTSGDVVKSDDPDLIGEEAKKHPPIKKEIHELLSYWNNLELVQRHKFPTTKVYCKAAKMLNQLRLGTFGKHYDVEADFLEYRNIPKSLLKKKWTVDEIKDALTRLQDYHRVGYWPSNNTYGDDKLTRQSLPNLLFNIHARSSIFLWVAVERPAPSGFIAENKYPEITNQYIKLIEEKNGRGLDAGERNKVARGVDQVVKFFDTQVCQVVAPLYELTGFSSTFGNEKKGIQPFVDTHLRFLRDRNRLTPSSADTKSSTWKYFMVRCREFHGYILDPTKDELRTMKKDLKVRAARVERMEQDKQVDLQDVL